VIESHIRAKLKEKEILLMTHIVLGYPSFDDCFKVIEAMVKAGVDLMELQIPFSEPIADGPIILRANQKALEGGATVKGCLDFAAEATRAFDIPFLIMSYYNIFFKHETARFVAAIAERGIRGAIVPDLPPEEGESYLTAMKGKGLAPILLFSPTTPFERMKYIAAQGEGFIYCVARKGVTGRETEFSGALGGYLSECRRATRLPLAVGFGIKERADVDYLRGKADIAVIGTQTIRVSEKGGIRAVEDFIGGLR
jgi:tryptophan synthase alpha chain